MKIVVVKEPSKDLLDVICPFLLDMLLPNRKAK
jgi:hypothetical protein